VLEARTLELVVERWQLRLSAESDTLFAALLDDDEGSHTEFVFVRGDNAPEADCFCEEALCAHDKGPVTHLAGARSAPETAATSCQGIGQKWSDFVSPQHTKPVFEYDEFPTELDDEAEGRDVRQSVDLATEIARSFSGHAVLSAGEPIWEDFGAVLPVSSMSGVVHVFISYWPCEDSDSSWALEFRQRKSFLKSLLARPDDDRVVSPVKEAIAEVVSRDPERFRKVRWMN